MECSIRTRQFRLAAATTALCAAPAACSSSYGVLAGHALTAVGPQGNGTLGFSSGVVGQTYGLAERLISNPAPRWTIGAGTSGPEFVEVG